MKVLDNNNYVNHMCPACKSELGIYQSDIVVCEFSSPQATCAACGHTFEISHGVVPASWLRDLYDDDVGH